MIILRHRLFSDKNNKKDDDNDKINPLAVGGAGMLVGSASDKFSKSRTKRLGKKLLNGERISEREREELTDKLVKRAEKQGTKIVKDETFGNAAAVEGGSLGRAIKRASDKNPKLKQALENSGPLKHIGTDTVVLGKGKLSDPEILAHELGHTQYVHKGRSKDIIGKAAHKTQALSKFGTGSVANVAYAAGGFKSGMKSAKNKAEGKKERTWDKVKSVAIPAAVSAPLLITEGAASRKGLKMLKEAGASKEAIKTARKNLGTAYKTYLTRAEASMLSGEGGRLAGKAIGKRKYEKEKNKKEKD